MSLYHASRKDRKKEKKEKKKKKNRGAGRERKRERDRQTDRQTDRERQTDTDRDTERLTETETRLTETETDRDQVSTMTMTWTATSLAVRRNKPRIRHGHATLASRVYTDCGRRAVGETSPRTDYMRYGRRRGIDGSCKACLRGRLCRAIAAHTTTGSERSTKESCDFKKGRGVRKSAGDYRSFH